MKQLKATMHPVNFWTSLTQVGGFMLVTAAIFSGLASMLWRLTMLPSRIPDGMPKMHIVGFNFHRYTFRALKTLVRLAMRVLAVLDLTTTSST